jgi:hypothetical protein
MKSAAPDIALGFLAAWLDRLVVAALTRGLRVLGEREEGCVEGTGDDVGGTEQVPRAAVGPCVLVALRERCPCGVEHRVVGGADRCLEMAGIEELRRGGGPIA